MTSPRQSRLARWLALMPQAALLCCGVGTLRFVEALVRPPPMHDSVSRLALAAWTSSIFWIAGAVLGLAAFGLRLARGTHSDVAAQPKAAAALSPDMRRRGWGFGIVAAYAALVVVAVIVMADTVTGPFAWIATRVFGLTEAAGLVTFLIGVPVLLAPLLLLALLPWQEKSALLAGMQAAVKPPPQTSLRKRHR